MAAANAGGRERQSEHQTPIAIQKDDEDNQNKESDVVSGVQLVAKIPQILPHERVFPIQIGTELFKLSGASLSSDAPSYFSQYFKCQIGQAKEKGLDISTAIRTLYIDRDPVTFNDIALHLRGYYVQPSDGMHFVRLFADAQFYNLPKLISQLHEAPMYVSIGHRDFQIPRELLTGPGNSPNYFSLGFAIFFSSPEDMFPGLDREELIRPPSIMPPEVPQRSGETFAELLRLLRGYPVEVRDETHRAALLRDCRYYNFKGLEQQVIPHSITFNQARRREEITIRLDDILKSGVSVAPDPSAADPLGAWVNYARPYVDTRAYELVLEIGGEAARLQFGPGGNVRAEFFRDVRLRLARLFEVICTKLNLPPTAQPLGLLMTKGGASSQPATPGNTPLSEDLVRVMLDPEASIVLDGQPWIPSEEDQLFLSLGKKDVAGPGTARSTLSSAGGIWGGGSDPPSSANVAVFPSWSRKRKRADAHGPGGADEWIVKTGQWRLRIQGTRNGKAAVECVLVAVKLDVLSAEQSRNVQRPFLGG